MEIAVNDIRSGINNYFSFLKSKKYIFVIVLGVSLIFGLAYAILKKPKYEANLSFIINENDKGISSSLLSLAGQSGLLMGGGGLTPNDDKILFLFTSRKILGDALLKKYESPEGPKLIGNGIINELKLLPSWSSDTAMNGFEGFHNENYEKLNWQENKAIDEIIYDLVNFKLISFESLKKKSLVGQSTGIIFLQVVLKDELLAKALVEQLYYSLSGFYIQNSIQKEQFNVDLLERKVDSIQTLIRQKEDLLGHESDYNYNTFKASGKVNEYRLKRDLEMLNTIFAEVMKNYELAKLTLEQQKPFFKLIDTPTFPLKVIYKSKLKYSLLAGFAASSVVFLFFTLMYFRRRND